MNAFKRKQLLKEIKLLTNKNSNLFLNNNYHNNGKKQKENNRCIGK